MTKPTKETRATSSRLELRTAAADETGRTAAGYAVLFNVESRIGNYFIERVAPGAFSKSLAERDVLALHSHDTGRVVGRKGAGTLALREDATGLAFENPLPDTSDGRDLAVQIDRGDVGGMSFGFISRREEWDETGEIPKRTILEADLYEITYTALPQYPDTTVALRSLEGARAERQVPPIGTGAARRARQAQIERRI